LQKAIDGKATPGEIKAALAKYDEVRKAKEEQLKAARENLRKALTARQEAIASLLGLL
jgi:outer membrane protein TolC